MTIFGKFKGPKAGASGPRLIPSATQTRSP